LEAFDRDPFGAFSCGDAVHAHVWLQPRTRVNLWIFRGKPSAWPVGYLRSCWVRSRPESRPAVR